MDFRARMGKLGNGSRVAIAVAVVAVAATAWVVPTVTESTAAPHQNVAQQGESNDGDHSGQDGAQGSGGGGGTQQGRIPEGIAHASETGGNAVNITIDDGPDPVWTPKVLDVLKRYGVKATFCMIGPQAKAHPDLVKQVVAAGHRLCDHTVDHDTTMDKKPVAYQEKEILDAKKMIEQAAGGGAEVMYYRAPGGAFTPDSRRIAAANGMRPLGWNVDSKDFSKPGTAAIVDTVKKEIGNGPTILFHDGGGDRQQTVEALGQVLGWLKAQGRPTGFPVQTTP
ncbi:MULTISPECIES: polysaccharide deacetylase family protein [Kitasatospora]|uniref:Polysaccharide deacetylase family protein n=1 Tax=Kitasatospora cathayae TaxID=3004092 RepID=A0ABY7QDL3_9ACTN|nr:polysaccharide deacetylase family protein [Kitasatospora sp. HUAS 3-15]WBP90641.1 polysaccharide deacetylase family protein [Kitasatospora sp. HUAS 3-15]